MWQGSLEVISSTDLVLTCSALFYGDLFDKVKITSHIGSWSKRLLTATKMLHLLAEEIHTQIRNSV